MSTASNPPPQGAPGTAFRFVHCADVHLDSPFHVTNDDVRARLHDAGRAAFARMVDLCLAERVHALLVAGDLFSDERLSFATEDFILEQVTRLSAAGIHVVVACGNHDTGSTESRAARMSWPTSHFTLVSGHEPQEVTITAADGSTVGRVIGCGHADDHDAENLAALFPAAGGSVPTVGLLHARVAEADRMQRHPAVAPCTLADLAGKGYRYWALGHVHTRQAFVDPDLAPDKRSAAGPLACYPGTLIGHRPEESGAHGALLVTVPQHGAVSAEFHELAGVRWETLPLDDSLATIADLSVLRAMLRESFHRTAAADTPEHVAAMRWMLRVDVSGACPAAAQLQRDEVLEEMAEQLAAELEPDGVLAVELIEAGVRRPVELDGHRGQPHVLGLSLAVLDALAEDDELLESLAPATLAGCHGTDAETRRAYLRSLLIGIDGAAGEVLLKETLA